MPAWAHKALSDRVNHGAEAREYRCLDRESASLVLRTIAIYHGRTRLLKIPASSVLIIAGTLEGLATNERLQTGRRARRISNHLCNPP